MALFSPPNSKVEAVFVIALGPRTSDWAAALQKRVVNHSFRYCTVLVRQADEVDAAPKAYARLHRQGQRIIQTLSYQISVCPEEKRSDFGLRLLLGRPVKNDACFLFGRSVGGSIWQKLGQIIEPLSITSEGL